MVQATIIFEDMIRTEHLKKEWWYWSSPSAVAKISTVQSLALQIYALDAAIVYEKPPPPPLPPTPAPAPLLPPLPSPLVDLAEMVAAEDCRSKEETLKKSNLKNLNSCSSTTNSNGLEGFKISKSKDTPKKKKLKVSND